MLQGLKGAIVGTENSRQLVSLTEKGRPLVLVGELTGFSILPNCGVFAMSATG